MANTFDWIEIRTSNIEKSAHFYESLFGWNITDRVTADDSAVWLFDTGSEPRLENLRRGGIWLRPSDEPSGVVVYVLVDNIDTTLKKAAELGGKMITPRTSQGSSFRAYFADPEGTVFGLWEEVPDS